MEIGKWLKLQWDRVAAWVCIGVGALALIVGWVGVSGAAYMANAMPYLISGGIGGMFLLGLGGMLWLSADLRDEWYKLDSLERSVNRQHEELLVAEDAR
ncbi:hypothetical protein [Sporichthya sp.]|uniref:hypothetical protein n=1 Tax=Sporichthya sp. TaxID=65475 RepID=UPI0017F1FB69|nr:hypothetical protein [Sporichthya sp.]MBA3741408.1 hypothetical protein [Sporichthya sp.]